MVASASSTMVWVGSFPGIGMISLVADREYRKVPPIFISRMSS